MKKVLKKVLKKDLIIGMNKAAGDIAIKLLRSRWLNKTQISEVTGLDKEKLDELEIISVGA